MASCTRGRDRLCPPASLPLGPQPISRVQSAACRQLRTACRQLRTACQQLQAACEQLPAACQPAAAELPAQLPESGALAADLRPSTGLIEALRLKVSRTTSGSASASLACPLACSHVLVPTLFCLVVLMAGVSVGRQWPRFYWGDPPLFRGAPSSCPAQDNWWAPP